MEDGNDSDRARGESGEGTETEIVAECVGKVGGGGGRAGGD